MSPEVSARFPTSGRPLIGRARWEAIQPRTARPVPERPRRSPSQTESVPFQDDVRSVPRRGRSLRGGVGLYQIRWAVWAFKCFFYILVYLSSQAGWGCHNFRT